MKDFIFGSLTTLEQRVAYMQAQSAGVRHQYQLEPRAPRPEQAPAITVTVALPETFERVLCTVTEPETADIDLQPGPVKWDLLNWRYYQVWQGTLPARPAGTLVRYTVQAYPKNSSTPVAADDGATFSYLVGDPASPAWAAEAIIYQVLPDRFYPGDGRDWLRPDNLSGIYGGTLRGITDKLSYIADLGFNCIWLNPFFPDESHHGYHATDYFAVNPRLGTAADVHELLQQAHRRGIRVLLDFVANHWSKKHPTFRAAQSNPHSDYVNWYDWHEWPHAYQTFFGVPELPKVNLDYPPARKHMLSAARYWLTEFDFDGYRLDYALGPSFDFWTEFRATVKAIRPDAWIFGEVVETPVTQLSYEGRLDGCLDFLLAQALRETFAFGSMDLAAFDNFLYQHEAFFPTYFSRPSFLDNHDMNRFLWLVRGDKRKLKLAALCQFTLSGPPIVYYGTEAGLSQERDIIRPDDRHIMEEGRQPMPWGPAQDEDLQGYYHWLVQLRRRRPVLWRGRRQTVCLDASAGVYAYLRQDEDEAILISFNLSEEERTFTIAGRTITLSPCSGQVDNFD